jgi:CDP-glycerol glycerophosphotransferase (TagB/SpsB family)
MQLKNFILSLCKFLTYIVAFPLEILIPKDRNKWTFGAWEGLSFTDNSKYLYLYIYKNQKCNKISWICKNRQLFNFLNDQGVPALWAGSIKAYWWQLRSKYIVVTHGAIDVLGLPIIRSNFIYLDHVICPIKEMGSNNRKKFSNLKDFILKLLTCYDRQVPHWSIASSEFTANLQSKALGITSDKQIISLPPRVDKIRPIQGISKKKFLYVVPTYRASSNFNFFANLNFDNFNKVLKKIDMNMVVRLHPFDAIKYQDTIKLMKNYSNFMIDHSDDILEVLPSAEILITDYSSIFADFLLLNKEIVFAKFDHENYIKYEHRLACSYDDLPGTIVNDWTEIEFYLMRGFDTSNKRSKYTKMIFNSSDFQGACKAVYEKILEKTT